MSIFNKNIVQINGPINVVRMEGEVNNIKKVIYIFMDQHYSLIDQTECDNVFAKDINIFLAEKFSKLNDSDKTYDFFLEIMPTKTKNVKYGLAFDADVNHRDIYIGSVLKLFRKIFQYDTTNNKILVSQYFRNVRLHYMDVRDYFKETYYQLIDAEYISTIIMANQDICQENMDKIINILSNFKTRCEIILSVLKSNNTNSKKSKLEKINLVNHTVNNPDDQIDIEKQKEIFKKNIIYIIDKIFNSYKHKNIQKKLAKQIDILQSNMSELISTSEYLINEFIIISKKNAASKNILTKSVNPIVKYIYGSDSFMILKMVFFIKENIDTLSYKSNYIFTRFMDVFFIRRFLDKGYITNAVSYTGSHHSNVYIEILSRDFGFKITHYFYSKIKDIEKLNAQIKKKDALVLGEIFYPPIRSQCSDMTNFPDNFL